MPENTERDTHFQDFAKLLWKDLLELNGYGYIDVSDAWCTDCDEHEPYINHIARRAYDLVWHTIKELGMDEHSYEPTPACFPEDIPDLTEWPTSSQEP